MEIFGGKFLVKLMVERVDLLLLLISADLKLTQFLTQDKKMIFRCFSYFGEIWVCAKFEVYSTPATGFISIAATSMTNIP